MASKVVVNELSECYVNLSFFDQSGVPYTPQALQYRVDNISDAQVVTPWTVVTPTSPTFTLTIPSASNALYPTANRLVQSMQAAFKVTAPGGAIRYDYAQYDLVAIQDVP